jgi:hypothetical protein
VFLACFKFGLYKILSCPGESFCVFQRLQANSRIDPFSLEVMGNFGAKTG